MRADQEATIDLMNEVTKLRAELTKLAIIPTLMGAFECRFCGARRDRDIDMPRAHRPDCLVAQK